MANLMLTKQCNLHCSYCFANEFVHRQSDVMSFENFLYCLDFLSHDVNERIGLIGGEPTLHPELRQMLIRLIDSPFSSICLFTNGILLDRYFNELRNSKFQILVNLNSPESTGMDNYLHTVDNIQEMIQRLYMRDQTGLSLNIHSPDQDFEYILRVLRDFDFRKLRLSLAIPNLEAGREIDPVDYFFRMLPTLRGLLRQMLEMDVAPVFDCNYLPFCLLTEEDRALFSQYENTMRRSNLLSANPICAPVLEILPDLHVVRCFGMSGVHKARLTDFRNTGELRRHFLAQIDAIAYRILPSEKCRGCGHFLRGLCSGGCYAYRQKAIQEAITALEKQFGGIA